MEREKEIFLEEEREQKLKDRLTVQKSDWRRK